MKLKTIKSVLCLLVLSLASNVYAQTQNSMTEVIPFKLVDGKIIITATINDETADFVLDLAGQNALIPEAIEKLHIAKEGNFGTYKNFVFKDVPVDNVYEIKSLSFGDNTFSNDLPFFELKDEPYLRKLGVVGLLNSSLFSTSVLTIDKKRQKITVTQPYRPSYMKLNYRETFDFVTGMGILCPITVNGSPVSLIMDTWSNGLINLTPKDFEAWNTKYSKGTGEKVSNGYKEATEMQDNLLLPDVSFGKTKIENATAVKNPYLKHSVVGKQLLDYGIVSIDYAHRRIYFQPFDLVPIPKNESEVTKQSIADGKLNPITRRFFWENIFDYRKGEEFINHTGKPIVIDFWATWCGPCMRLLPQMEAMAEQFKGKVIFYKVNADKEKDLCNHFGIQALPTLFFVPVEGKPIIEVGASPERYRQLIEEKLLK